METAGTLLPLARARSSRSIGRVLSVAPYYVTADLLVLPSIDMSEAFGLVLLEAMASGKPVIASDLPGVRTVVDNEHSGLLVKPRNMEDPVSKIEYLLDNDELRELFGMRGRKKAVEKYSWNKIASKLNEVYLKVMDESAH